MGEPFDHTMTIFIMGKDLVQYDSRVLIAYGIDSI